MDKLYVRIVPICPRCGQDLELVVPDSGGLPIWKCSCNDHLMAEALRNHFRSFAESASMTYANTEALSDIEDVDLQAEAMNAVEGAEDFVDWLTDLDCLMERIADRAEMRREVKRRAKV